MKIKRLLLLSVLFLSFFNAMAQIEVESFRPLTNDMTAKSLKGTKHDQNGKVCALIKIVTTERGFTFDGGSLGIVETAQKPGEIWVWVPPLSRKITISHEEFGVLREYDYDNYDIESGCTYELVLRTPKSTPIVPVPQVVETRHKCTLIVNSDKVGDLVFLNDSIVGPTPLSISVTSGQYQVKVKRGNSEEVQAIVIDKDVFKQLDFKFTRTIDIKTDKNGDAVYVDGQRVGYSPARVEIPYGKHTIKAERGSKYNDEEIVVEKVGGLTDYYLYLYTPQQHFTNENIVFATLNLGAGFGGANIVGVDNYFQKSFGFTVGSVKKVGWFFTAMTNFGFKALTADVIHDYNYNYPFFTGESTNSRMSFMGGLLLKMGSRSCFRLGAGYGNVSFAYKDTGGNWWKWSTMEQKGLDLSLGLQFNNKNHTVFSFDVVSTNFKTLEARLGIGVCMQKKQLFKN